MIDFGKIGAFPELGESILRPISLVITVKLTVINAKSQSQINAGI